MDYYALLAQSARQLPAALRAELNSMLAAREDPSTYVPAAGMTLAQYAVTQTLNAPFRSAPHAAQGQASARTH